MDSIAFQHEATPGLVSIVTPAFRAEKYLPETLASIERQSHADWELIVVEDGPPSATQSIVAEFARRHPSRRVFYANLGENFGPSHARNVAFAQCRGEFVALLDADDRWYPDFLAAAVQQLEATRADVAYASVVMIEDGTDRLLDIHGPRAGDLAAFPYCLYYENFITPSAAVLRRSVLADVGAWNTRYRYCEDLEFWLRAVAAGKQFTHIGGCHCLYRKNHASSATCRLCAVYEAFAEVVGPFAEMPGLDAKTCRKYVSKAYRRAGRYHMKSNPRHDTSADPRRAAGLVIKAWRLRPLRIDILIEAAKYAVKSRFRRQPPIIAPIANAEQPATRAAA